LRLGTHASHRFMLQLAESYLTSTLYRQILEAPKGRRNDYGRRAGEAGTTNEERGSRDVAVGMEIDP
jgi:hypothetical protein